VALLEPEDFKPFAAALPHPVRGWIPSSATLDSVVEALDVVRRSGVFVPVSWLSPPHSLLPDTGMVTGGGVAFTTREYAVLGGLRLGRPNRAIAYDLNMSESTVKVHVRNIMKKLRARNRTEVAFLAQNMFPMPR
jgi:DNA-binding NarL/FixJ family response regulator